MAEDLLEIQNFCQDVIEYSLFHFGVFRRFKQNSELFDVSIGKAVVGLQIYLRDELRTAFITSIGYITDSFPGTPALQNIRRLLNWSYFKGDIFNFMIGNLATLVEMIIFLDAIDLDFPRFWFPKLWSHIYWYRIKDELLSAGGFPQLIERVKTRYDLSGIYREMLRIISSRRLHMYSSLGIHRYALHNLYDGFNPRLDLYRNRPRTRSTVLSISIFDVIYHEGGVRDPNLADTLYAEIMDSRSIYTLYTRPRYFERLV